MGYFWAFVDFVANWVALMSGFLSLVREVGGMFSSKRAAPSTFWRTVWVAFILSAGLSWIGEHHKVQKLTDEVRTIREARPELKIYYDGSDLNHQTISVYTERIETGGSSPPFSTFSFGPIEVREGGKAPVQWSVAKLRLSPKEIWHWSGAGWASERSDDDKYKTAMRLSLGPIIRGDKVTIYQSILQGREIPPEIDATMEITSEPSSHAVATFKIVTQPKQ